MNMSKIKTINEEGEEIEIEAFTEDELNTRLAEKDSMVSILEAEKRELETKLGTTKEDNPNFRILKDALTKKDTEMKELREDVTRDKSQRELEAMDVKIQSIAKGNDEMAKKIKFHLDNTLSGLKEDTSDARDVKFKAALKLSADYSSESSNILDNIMAGGQGSGVQGSGGQGGVEFTTREKALGAKFGITEADYKKYGERLNKK